MNRMRMLIRSALLVMHGLPDAAADIRNFTITAFPPVGSSIIQVLPATDYLQVLAGVPYLHSLITSSGAFFGTSASLVNAKGVFANSTTCDASTRSVVGPPFDGLTKPTQLTQLFTKWSVTKYDVAGNFTICMNVSSSFSLIPVTIVSQGVTSSTLKIFCRYSSQSECTAALPGSGMSGVADAKLALVSFSSGVCGSSLLISAFNQTTSTAVVSSATSETHSFGYRSNSTSLGSFKACYCPSYQSSGGSSGLICTELPSNFVQTVGSLILMQVATLDPVTTLPASVYPHLKFDLHVLCGTGGCSVDSGARMKIVDSNTLNSKPYYDPSAGCRSALQTARYLGPTNCVMASGTKCSLMRSNAGDGTKVSFNHVQLESELVNNVRIQRSFDICFCDNSCTIRDNWFLVDTIKVLPLSLVFLQGSIPVQRLAVNVLGSVLISGSTAGSFRVSGSQSREMKILADPGISADAYYCMNTEQSSTLVGGHDCYSTTNCDPPILSTRYNHTYGSDLIQIKQAGWVAVCFCNAQCGTSVLNWFVVGRLLVAGPKGDQSWIATQSLPLALSVDGYGLKPQDSLKIISGDGDCADSPQLSFVAINQAAYVLSGSNLVALLDGYSAILGGNGTVIVFSQPHGLSEGDRIELSGISTQDADVDAMFNSDHTVSILSSQQVWINVQFGSSQFPIRVDLSLASWSRSSNLDFPSVAVSQAGIFKVCWVGSTTTAFAGTLTVSAPNYVSGIIDLGSLTLNTTGNITLSFNTSLSAPYALSPTVMQLAFTRPDLLLPIRNSGQGWTLAPSGSASCVDYITDFANSTASFPLNNCSSIIDSLTGSHVYRLIVSIGGGLIVPQQTYSVTVPVRLVSNRPLASTVDGIVQVWLLGPQDQRVVEVVYLNPH
jgi:hypothetical protein